VPVCSLYEPFYSILKMTNMKIDQKTDALLAHAHVRNDLPFMNWSYFLNTLQFNNNKIIHQKVDSISQINADGFINNWQFDLNSYIKAKLS